MGKLTELQLKHASFEGKTRKLFDGDGLHVVIQKSGKYFNYRYSLASRSKSLHLGAYPKVSLKDARIERDKARELVRRGVDPSLEKRLRKAKLVRKYNNTFQSIAMEWFEHVHLKKVAPTSSGRNLRRLEKYVFPHIGPKPIESITPRDILEILWKIEEMKKLDTVGRVKNLCGQIFRYGITLNVCERDVTSDLKGLISSPKKRHFPAIVEPKEIGKLLRAIHGYEGLPTVKAALRFAPLVFVRPGELRNMKWDDLDLDTGDWSFLPSKGGLPMITPLPPQAIEILRKQQYIARTSPYVFPSVRMLSRPISDNTINGALHTLGYKGKMTAHGFRAMARTALAERLNFPIEVIEMQLAHAVRDTNGRAYNRTTYYEQRKEMLEAWANYLDKLMSET